MFLFLFEDSEIQNIAKYFGFAAQGLILLGAVVSLVYFGFNRKQIQTWHEIAEKRANLISDLEKSVAHEKAKNVELETNCKKSLDAEQNLKSLVLSLAGKLKKEGNDAAVLESWIDRF